MLSPLYAQNKRANCSSSLFSLFVKEGVAFLKERIALSLSKNEQLAQNAEERISNPFYILDDHKTTKERIQKHTVVCLNNIEEELDRKKGSCCRCYLVDVLGCRTDLLAARMIWRKVFVKTSGLGALWLVWCVNWKIIHFLKHPFRQVSIFLFIHPFLQIIRMQNSYRGKELHKFRPPNSSYDLCLLFCINPSSMLK